MTIKPAGPGDNLDIHYGFVRDEAYGIIDAAKRSAARYTNSIMTAAYWLVGWRIVEFEQDGKARAGYGEQLVERLSADLTVRYKKGFSVSNVWLMRQFYLTWRTPKTASAEFEAPGILQTASGESETPAILQAASGELKAPMLSVSQSTALKAVAGCFPLPWSAYVKLMAVKNEQARNFYESEALRGGWSVRQLDRQINTRFYERTALSRDKAAMLSKGEKNQSQDFVSPEEEIKDPFVLEFLGLKDEYSESDLEEALILRMETFLLVLAELDLQNLIV